MPTCCNWPDGAVGAADVMVGCGGCGLSAVGGCGCSMDRSRVARRLIRLARVFGAPTCTLQMLQMHMHMHMTCACTCSRGAATIISAR